MLRGGKRRAMVFVDGSALRDFMTRKLGWHAGNETRIHYEKLGRILCGPDRDFLRLNYYTAEPARYFVQKRSGEALLRKPRSGQRDRVLTPHERDTMHRVQNNHNVLREHIDHCKYTTLATGRMVTKPLDENQKEVLNWVERVFKTVKTADIWEEDFQLVKDARKAVDTAAPLLRSLADRLVELSAAKAIHEDFMRSYPRNLSVLLGKYIDFREKGVDVHLAVDMLELSVAGGFDDAIIFAADEDYVPVVQAVMRHGHGVVQAFFESKDYPGQAHGYPLGKMCDDSRCITVDELERLLLPVEKSHPDSLVRFQLCSSCWEPFHPEARKCPHCHAEVVANPATSQPSFMPSSDTIEEVTPLVEPDAQGASDAVNRP